MLDFKQNYEVFLMDHLWHTNDQGIKATKK
jgi:hypothetical protein